MRALVRTSFSRGYAAGFSADFARNDIDCTRHHASDVYDRTRIYGTQCPRPPAPRHIYLGVRLLETCDGDCRPRPAHGPPPADPMKYRVVNSWGGGVGDHGTYHMYAEWFEQNVFKLAIHKSVLERRERAAYAHPGRARRQLLLRTARPGRRYRLLARLLRGRLLRGLLLRRRRHDPRWGLDIASFFL